MFDKYVAPDLTAEQLTRVKQKMSVLEKQSPEELALAASQLAHPQANPSSAPTKRKKKKLRKPPK